MSGLNSYKNWRQIPQGTGVPVSETQIAENLVWPAETAEQTAERSAQIVPP